VHVLQAKGEADAMQYTLPLRKNRFNNRSWSRSSKGSTIKNAEAAAEAKVIDSKAEWSAEVAGRRGGRSDSRHSRRGRRADERRGGRLETDPLLITRSWPNGYRTSCRS